METVSWLFGVIAWLGCVIVLFRLFKMKGILHGFLGLVFPIYPFIWGIKHWNDPEYGVKKGMIMWLVIGGLAGLINIILMFSGS